MRKRLLIVLLCVMTAYIGACGVNPGIQTGTEPSRQEESTVLDTTAETTVPATTEAVTQPSGTTCPAEVPTTTATEPTTEPEHSVFYIPGLDVEDVILYFCEVCLDAEIVNEGDATLLQKWTEPISYKIEGQPTDEDVAAVSDFTAWLNAVEGFPGVAQTQDPGAANLRIHFCSWEDMLVLMGEEFAGMDGAVTFWYLDNEIYNGIICVRSDIGQHLRNSVIREEIYNGLGPVQDTALRPDSIIYSEYSEPQRLSVIDELIMQLLYHPMMQCGMNAAECETVIRQLYY